MTKRATTMAEFRRKPDTEKRSLMILLAKDAATLVTRFFSFSDIAGELSGIYWHPMIEKIPDLTYNSREIGGNPTPTWSDARLRAEDGYDISTDRSGIYIEDLGVTWIIQDQPISCYFGGDDLPLSEYAQVFAGTVNGVRRNDNGITFDISGIENQIKRLTIGKNKITTAAYPNCGANVGKSKPVCIGYCPNMEPVLVDTVAYRYMYHEGAGAGFFFVYQDGVTLTTPAQYTDNLDGTFTLVAAPTGRITCFVAGPYYNAAGFGSVLSGVLQTWGGILPAQIDAAAIAAADVALPWQVAIAVMKETSVSNVIAQLADGVPAWYGFRKDGKFSLREVTDPASGTANWTIEESVSSEYPIAFLDGSLTINQASVPTYRVNMNYYRNQSPTTSNQLNPALTEAQKLSFTLPFRLDYYQDTATLTKYPLAGEETKILNSIFVAQAVSAATKWVNLLKVPRVLLRLTVKAMELRYEIGDIVAVTYQTELADGSAWYRHGLNAKKFLITGLRENYGNATITIDLWG